MDFHSPELKMVKFTREHSVDRVRNLELVDKPTDVALLLIELDTLCFILSSEEP
jgi:hypothetical protein